MATGVIRKLVSEHKKTIEYSLPLSDDKLSLNELVGKKISLVHTGAKFCIKTNAPLKKTYGQGYSWDAFITAPECDQCIVKPELCHFAKGTCRDEAWGEAHCMQPHIIDLSVTSGLKIGITRKTQIPTRWVDQGASFAIKICEVKNRLTSGLIETEIAKEMSDKTNWRAMLKNEYPEIDLLKSKKEILQKHADLFKKYNVKILEDEVFEFTYPVETYPTKVSSLNFDKNPEILGKLMGIKGQYLIFDSGVINMRKFQGYEVNLTVK